MRYVMPLAILLVLLSSSIMFTPQGNGDLEIASDIRGKISPDLKSYSDPDSNPIRSNGGSYTRGIDSFIIQFEDGPRQDDGEFLLDLGFVIRRTFTAVPGLSVDGPANLIHEIARNRRVTYVENNDPVVLDMEMGTHVINATQVWSSLLNGPAGVQKPIDGRGVTVCVVDTGIDAGHPDLDYGEKTIKNVYDAGGGLWIEAENTDTNYGHGTHVAGTVAGNGDASAGARRGVAPGANLIGITVSIPEEVTTPLEDGYIQSLEWVYEHSKPGNNPNNIRVVTNSWHSTVEEYNPDSMLTKLIEKLTFENNVISTWSAGNDGRDDPGGDELTTSGQGNTPVGIMVAAYERDGSAVTDFSSRGRVGANHTYPDIGAPGRSIWSTSARRTVISGGTYAGGNTNPYYLAISGTSMSTPHVAGLVALLWQAAPSMRISEMHEDYSGDNQEEWFTNPRTRIHEVEWILEASANFLPPTEEHGNVAGDTNSTGWGNRPVDYVQGYGLVDAKKAVGIALTLESLRRISPDPYDVSVYDAINVYKDQGVSSTITVNSSRAMVSWSGEFSRYNDQAMNPLSLVNQTKYVEVPPGATRATVTMSYSGFDASHVQAADIAFTIDTDRNGEADHQSTLSIIEGGPDQMEIDADPGDLWTFGIVGRGVKVQRPLQDINYIELRVEYDINIVFDLEGNDTSQPRPLNAVYAPSFPGEPADGGTPITAYSYDLRGLELPVEEVPPPEEERGFPWLILALIAVAVVSVAGIIWWKKSKSGKNTG